MDIVFATSSGSVLLGPVPVQVIAGRAYPKDDPIVVAYPHLFAPAPVVYDWRGNVVEQATAAPGERRGTRRG